jgi:hypothetical protein
MANINIIQFAAAASYDKLKGYHMRNWKIILLMVWLGFVMGMVVGCNGITADASHAALLDNTAGWAQAVTLMADLPDVCKDPAGLPLTGCDCVGGFTKAQAKALLKQHAELWAAFRAAKDGKAPLPASPKIGN